ncbi:MAG: glycosyltransferase family 39 protein [Acidobacteriota bacterium]
MPRIGGAALLALFALALAARLAAVLRVGLTSVQFGDGPAYLFAARFLATTGEYPSTTDVGFFRPPGYPAFLVLATLGNPSNVAAAKLAGVLVGALSILILVFLSARIFRSRGLAIATGALAAVNPDFLVVASDVQSETLFLFLLLAAAFLLLAAVDRPSSSASLLSGIALGLAALTRPTALVFVLLLLAPLLDRRYPRRVRAHIAGAAVLGFLLAVCPWTLRNAVRFHEFIPVNDAGGRAFYEGNSVWARRYYEIGTRAEYARWSVAMDRDIRERLGRLEAAGALSPRGRSRAFARMGVQDIRDDPGAALRLFARKAWQWARPYPTTWFWPARVVVLVGIFYGALTVLAAIGLARPERPGVCAFAAAVLVLSLAVHVLIIVVWRYRIPFWDPVLILYAVPGGAKILGR